MPFADDWSSRIKKETVLHEVGPWKLVKHDTSLGGPPGSLLLSYIAHTCVPTGSNYYWYNLGLINEACDGCHENPPKEIMGLWKLHNMDYIQKGISF